MLPPEVYAKLRTEALQTVRGTVQADILKEDQAQNTCIFSTEFSLKVMGDIQQTFIEEKVRNFYSVSISGYHIAEAGANPITQLAFTLANGFTFVEYYLSRGMHIDDFAPNLSFFFSNGLDPEYSVIGRVARRIWAVAMKEKYGANDRSQKLKYHIQTSGRSLHAQEIDFNDIRTTLQALYAIYDNCNSLHTNAYDEAITTPTEESVRRAIAIQLIINRELGLAKNENPLQGAFLIEQMTELVEEAVLTEFRRLADRGGVLGAMETMYQRGKIQEESMHYEHLKHSGELPIVGVNTFLNPQAAEPGTPELIRSTEAEKQQQIRNLEAFHARNADRAPAALARLKDVARGGRQPLRRPPGCRQGLQPRPDQPGPLRSGRAVPEKHVSGPGEELMPRGHPERALCHARHGKFRARIMRTDGSPRLDPFPRLPGTHRDFGRQGAEGFHGCGEARGHLPLHLLRPPGPAGDQQPAAQLHEGAGADPQARGCRQGASGRHPRGDGPGPEEPRAHRAGG